MFYLSCDFPWYVSHSTPSRSYWCAQVVASPPYLVARLLASHLAYVSPISLFIPCSLRLVVSHLKLQVLLSLVLSYSHPYLHSLLVFKYSSCVLWSLRLNILLPLLALLIPTLTLSHAECAKHALCTHLRLQPFATSPPLDPTRTLVRLALIPQIHLGLPSVLLCPLQIYLGLYPSCSQTHASCWSSQHVADK